MMKRMMITAVVAILAISTATAAVAQETDLTRRLLKGEDPSAAPQISQLCGDIRSWTAKTPEADGLALANNIVSMIADRTEARNETCVTGYTVVSFGSTYQMARKALLVLDSYGKDEESLVGLNDQDKFRQLLFNDLVDRLVAARSGKIGKGAAAAVSAEVKALGFAAKDIEAAAALRK